MRTCVLLACLATPLLVTPATLLAQGRWREVTPLVSPSPRLHSAMAWDSVRQRVVLFGGDDGGSQFYNDTWEWDGFLWHMRRPAQSPPALRYAAIAYDAARRRTVLFGGAQETWEWDGDNWLLRNPPARPPARERHAMTYDASRSRVVLFGGRLASDLGDTWEYDGVTWSNTTPLFGPQPRSWHAMAYDARRRLVVLAGGIGGPQGDSLRDTWVWNGKDWNARTNLQPTHQYLVPDRLIYDESRQIIVHVGVSNYNNNIPLAFSEDWDGNAWSQPIAWQTRYGFGAAHDGRSGGVVLFGGHAFYGPSNETWLFTHDCWPLAPGHAGGGAPSACITPPVLGGRFCVAFAARQGVGVLLLSPGTCGDAWAQLGPPLLCAQGSLYPSPVGLEAFAAYGDPALTCKTIPFDLALLGSRLCLQGAGLELPTCFRLTDGVRAVIRLP